MDKKKLKIISVQKIALYSKIVGIFLGVVGFTYLGLGLISRFLYYSLNQSREMHLELIKSIIFGFLAYFLAFSLGPSLIKLLRWLKFWKKKSRTTDTLGQEFVVMKKFYAKDESKLKIPRAGGILIWLTTLTIAFVFWLIFKIDEGGNITLFLNFVNRRQTFIPLGVLFVGAILGFVDDALATLETGSHYHAGGLKLSYRIGFVGFVSFVVGLWFRFRLNYNNFTIIPEFFKYSDLLDWLKDLGINGLYSWFVVWGMVLFIVIYLVGLWSSSVIDGYDGLAVGTLIPIYLCITIIAFYRDYYAIATLMSVMIGTMFAYLWYNLPPAKFYLGDTGSAPLLLTLGVVSYFIDAVYVLPIAGIMLLMTTLSNVIQVTSKKIFKRKVFLAAPIHHHFEAMGIHRLNVTFGYWIITIIFSILATWIGVYFS